MNKHHMQQGFSLIELLVVISIVSLVYFLGFGKISLSKSKHTLLKPKEFLSHISNNFTKGTLICTNQCQKCYFKQSLNTSPVKLNKIPDLGKDITIYKLDSHNILNNIDFGKYHDEKICLSINFYPNGSHTKFIIESTKGIYFVNVLYDDVKEASSLEDAKNLWIEDKKYLYNLGDFY